ncbi:putative disease resistance protein RGA4 [Populus alba]|uniref:putative disease resistance protein RGA4 n=1 Tax=Populus alba TaxID=43335 RepID=UPI003CC74346
MAEGVLFNIAEEIIKTLGSLTAQEVALWWGLKDQLRKLNDTVTRIKAVIQDAEEQAQKQNHQIEVIWLMKLREAVYDAEDLLDDFSTQVVRKQLMPGKRVSREVRLFFSRSNQFVYGLRMGHRVKALRERLDNIETDSKIFHFEVRDEERASSTTAREQTTSSEPEKIVGRESDKEAVKNFLMNSNKDENVSVISVVGMGGLGKTTLAQHVFNDERVKANFGVRLWVSVSGSLDVRKIIKGAVGTRDFDDQLKSLKKEFEEKIGKQKYLLVLDDVWDGEDGLDGEKWDRLKELLPRDAVGSKIVVTTRSHVIAKFTSTIEPHVLKGLSVDESWDLFRRKAFPQGQEWGHVHERIRKEIVERCCGVPLVIKAIARLTSLKDRAQWLSFILDELPDSIRDDNIIQTLKLSYDALPSFMKHCFAYCSLFPKGHKIDVKYLIRLWIAQGFVSSSNSGRRFIEIVGLKCFESLLWRSFFHEVKKDRFGNIESCKMHDFMHDLATHVAGFQSIKVERGGNRISELTRHVSFDTELDLSLPSAQRLRTLVLLQGGKWDEGAWESICRDFRRLRVLVLSDFGMEEVSSLIEKLKHLKYLDLSNNEMEALPNSITTLVNLQVLKLNGCKKLKELPRDIGKLINLRHLDVGSYLDDDLCENLEYMPRGIGKLTSLQTLSCFVAAKNRSSKSVMIGGLDELSRLNELRGRLEIRVKGYDSGSCVSEFEGAKLKDKQYLHSLTIKWDIDSDSDIYLYDEMLPSLQPNSILQELVVAGYGGMRFPGWVSHLSNLARIRLERCRRLEHIPPLHGILALEELSIADMDSLEYIDSEGVGGRGVSMFFPSLKELHIFDCPRLKRWWEKSRDEMNDDSDESTKEMLCFPRLSSLSIVDCPNLTSMPLFPTLSILILSRASSMPLQETMKMTPPVSSSSSSLFIRPLSKLKNLYIYFIDDMEYLPEVGLQNLSSLQQLSIRGCSRLKSLPLPDQGMPSLQKLNISSCKELEYLSQSEYQGIPYLTSLQELEISYCRGELRMIEYGGMRFPSWSPSWLSHLSNLARIDLYGCRRLEHIPPLHGIPSLDELSIADMDSLEYIDSEGDGGRGVSMFFPSLKKLRIFDCPSLKGWWKNCRDEMNDDSEESTKEEELIILCFPCLSSLSIVYCPNLTSMPLFPTLDESLHLWETSSMPLQETMKMKSPVFSSSSSSSSSSFIRPLSKLKNLDIGAIRDMESLPEVGLQNLSSLQQLFIYECPSLKSLPLHDKGMHSLQILCIKSCSQLKSLSEESQGMTLSEYESQGMIPFLPSLQVLRIDDCNEELSGRTRGWGRESEEWPKIKHILNIVIDGYYIQEEGRYVKQISRGGLGYYSPYGY